MTADEKVRFLIGDQMVRLIVLETQLLAAQETIVSNAAALAALKQDDEPTQG